MAKSNFPQQMGLDIQYLLEDITTDFSEPQPLQYYFYFSDKHTADKLAAPLQAEGFQCTITYKQKQNIWLCLVEKASIIDIQELNNLGARFERLAQELDGRFIKWDYSLESDFDEDLSTNRASEWVAIARKCGGAIGNRAPDKLIYLLADIDDEPTQLTEAEEVALYQQELEEDPLDVSTRINLASVLAQFKQPQEAIAVYLDGIDLDPGCGELHYALAQAYALENQIDQSLGSLKTAFSIDKKYISEAKNDPCFEQPEFALLFQSPIKKVLNKLGFFQPK